MDDRSRFKAERWARTNLLELLQLHASVFRRLSQAKTADTSLVLPIYLETRIRLEPESPSLAAEQLAHMEKELDAITAFNDGNEQQEIIRLCGLRDAVLAMIDRLLDVPYPSSSAGPKELKDKCETLYLLLVRTQRLLEYAESEICSTYRSELFGVEPGHDERPPSKDIQLLPRSVFNRVLEVVRENMDCRLRQLDYNTIAEPFYYDDAAQKVIALVGSSAWVVATS